MWLFTDKRRWDESGGTINGDFCRKSQNSEAYLWNHIQYFNGCFSSIFIVLQDGVLNLHMFL
ncbi:MAG: hypothetical protein HFH88_16325 [Lachnospiraceae bacterium]|nr:hypothetical protein [Lachnospiraceae bacterium]